MFPEGVVNGMFITGMVVFHSRWLSTFDDELISAEPSFLCSLTSARCVFNLQGTAVHVQCPGGGGNITGLFVQHPLNMLPIPAGRPTSLPFQELHESGLLVSLLPSAKAASNSLQGGRLVQIIPRPPVLPPRPRSGMLA